MRAHLAPADAAAEIIRLREALWCCLLLSGADTSDYDGPESWPGGISTPLEVLAVQSVRELRQQCDEADDA